MKDMTEQLILSALERYRSIWRLRSETDLLVESIASWLKFMESSATDAINLIEALRPRIGAMRTYRDVAAAGFLSAATLTQTENTGYFRAGLLWITERKATFEEVPTGFAVDGVALLGLAVGVSCLAEPSLTQKFRVWLSSFVAQSMESHGIPSWQKLLIRVATSLVNIDADIVVYTGEFPDIYLALYFRGVLPSPSSAELQRLNRDFVILVSKDPNFDLDYERLALRLAAFESLKELHLSPRSTPSTGRHDEADSSTPNLRSPDPNSQKDFTLKILLTAIQAVPALKYILGVVGIVAAVSLIGGLVLLNWVVAVVGFVFVFLGGVLVVVFANFASSNEGSFKLPAKVLTWLATIILCLASICLFTSVFFGHPLDLRHWLDNKVRNEPQSRLQTHILSNIY